MHVGLNLIYLVPGYTGGTEVYARQLIPKLVATAPAVRFTAFINREASEDSGAPWNEGTLERVVLPVKARNRLEWVRAEQALLPRSAQRAGIDVLHSLANTGPAWGAFTRLLTIHDLSFRLEPQAHLGLLGLGMRVLVPLAARRAARVITDAEATRADLQRHLGISPGKIDVVPLGVGAPPEVMPLSESELRVQLSAGARPIVLCVAAKRRHKNLSRLIGALARIPPERRPLLVLPGYPTPHEGELRERASAAGVSGDVRFLGWISPSELEGLYRSATLFVFPSLMEGFGLPVLEAMARGLPVACSARGSLKEVAGDAALRFDPESEAAIAAAIERLLAETAERERLREAGLARAAQFTWAATARGTLGAYERALGTR